jgi:peptidoglycan/xylan/chitin deacetylase (PgdA/CDA1 family)
MDRAFPSGAVTLSFDDGWRCVYDNALPVLEGAGVKSSHYVISKYLDEKRSSLLMKVDQIRDLVKRGHEIGCHSASHKHLANESSRVIRKEIIRSRRDLAEIVGRVETFAYPYGEYDDRVLDVVKRAGFSGARSLLDGLNRAGDDPFLLKCKGITVQTTASEVKRWIDSARNENSWLILTFHQVDDEGKPWSTTPQVLEAIIRHVSDMVLSTITVRDGIRRLTGA